MSNLFLKQPRLLQHRTRIERLQAVQEGSWVELAENIVRPEGGGQPRDYGSVTGAAGPWPVMDVRKRGGTTWLLLDRAAAVEPGETVDVEVDGSRRKRLSRAHSLTHVLMASLRQITADFQSRGASICEAGDTVEVTFEAAVVKPEELMAVEALAARLITAGATIEIISTTSLQQARSMFPYFRVDPGLKLSGRVRLVHILGLDANPCSGSHLDDIAEIGSIVVTGITNRDDRTILGARLCGP